MGEYFWKEEVPAEEVSWLQDPETGKPRFGLCDAAVVFDFGKPKQLGQPDRANDTTAGSDEQ